MRVLLRATIITLALLVTGTVLVAYFAPYIYFEYEYWRRGPEPAVLPKPAVPVVGRWIDDYYVVEAIDATTIAIGEPRYYQGNYSYLIIGAERAVLFDAGTGTRDIVPDEATLVAIDQGRINSIEPGSLEAVGFFPRVFPVRGQ